MFPFLKYDLVNLSITTGYTVPPEKTKAPYWGLYWGLFTQKPSKVG
jgi:hypothetical protein